MEYEQVYNIWKFFLLCLLKPIRWKAPRQTILAKLSQWARVCNQELAPEEGILRLLSLSLSLSLYIYIYICVCVCVCVCVYFTLLSKYS
jgi:hypothetical protein